MQDHALKAFEVFVRRGAAVIACFESGDVSGAIEKLKLRNAAFANFKFYDALCGNYTAEYAKRLEDLGLRAIDDHKTVQGLLLSARDEEMRRLRAARLKRMAMGRFKSQRMEENFIEKSV